MNSEFIQTKINGWIVLDKPERMSSNSAMYRVRKFFSEKTGYVGTLDPFAQGILPIAIGEARKFIPYVNDFEKEYIFSIKFGNETDTLDRDGVIIRSNGRIPKLEEISVIIPNFVGDIEQIPPAFSAIKINGVRAYKLARKGIENIQLKPRVIKIHSLEIISENLKNFEVTLRCVCSKGTYIRSLARDLCHRLNTCGYVSYLRRSKVNFINNEKLVTIDKIMQLSYNEVIEYFLLPCESTLDDIPALTLPDNDILRLQNGLHVHGFRQIAEGVGLLFRVFRNSDGRFAGLVRFENNCFVPVRMCLFY